MHEYKLSPEVAGGLGPQSELDTSVHPPVVKRLHYEFAGWMGDDIVETFPAFIVTEALADAICASQLSGVILGDVIVTKDPQFEEFFPEVASSLPHWRWLQPVGTPHESDVWQDDNGQLVLSERALTLFRNFRIGHAESAVL